MYNIYFPQIKAIDLENISLLLLSTTVQWYKYYQLNTGIKFKWLLFITNY